MYKYCHKIFLLKYALMFQGEIRGTAFNDDADRLFPVLQINKVCLG